MRSRSHALGFWMMSIWANEGQSCAVCATSPHKPASHAVVVDVRDGIGAQRIFAGLERERGAARQAHAGMITRAYFRVDPETGAHHAFAGGYGFRHGGAHAALARELAFAVGDNHA